MRNDKSAVNPTFTFFRQIASRGLGTERGLWWDRARMEIKGISGVGTRRRKPDIQNSETQESDSWNWPLRLKRQSRARVEIYNRESCEMHERMEKRSRFAASVNKTKTTSTQAKGKSR